MSWCAKCFTVQTTSDFESEDDGEYEYFVNSRYICKRKKSVDSSCQAPKLVEATSSMSRTGVSGTSGTSSLSCSKVRSEKEKNPSSFDTSDMKWVSSYLIHKIYGLNLCFHINLTEYRISSWGFYFNVWRPVSLLRHDVGTSNGH